MKAVYSYPTEKFGHKQFTRSHMDIGLPDGARLTDSKFFDNKDARMVQWHKKERTM